MLKLAIFDLDNTLILDKYDEKGQRIVAEEAPKVLQFLKKQGFELYIASYNENAIFDIDASKTIKVEWFEDIWGCKTLCKHVIINMILQSRIDKLNNEMGMIDAPSPKKIVLFFDDLRENIIGVDDHFDNVISVLVDGKTGVKMSDIPKIIIHPTL